MPAKCEACIESWRNLHPNWTIQIWKDKDANNLFATELKRLGLPMSLLKTFPNFGELSDFLRYLILYQEGGIYADCDMECVQSMESTLSQFESKTRLFVGLAHVGSLHFRVRVLVVQLTLTFIARTACLEIGNAIIGCVPNHPLSLTLAKACVSESVRLNDQCHTKKTNNVPTK